MEKNTIAALVNLRRLKLKNSFMEECKMKSKKKFVSGMLVLVMLVGLVAMPQTTYAAGAKARVEKKAVHLQPGSWRDDLFSVNFAEYGDYITNLKTSSKNLSAKITRINQAEWDTCRANIGIYAAKKGEYTVKFDVKNADDKKVSSHSLKVYVNNDFPIKNISFDGKSMYTVSAKKSGKLSVTMNKGYTLKSIQVQTYTKDGKSKQKTVKNNSQITLGKYPYLSEYGGEANGYYSMSTSIMAQTIIYVTYKDKYTKENQTDSYVIYRLAN
ncbi:MAG: hypothetical protein NC489_25055 [Ruminococcus flavefaciens]|nr:hypothetical protein [Ruminococcus flavefaciens]